MSDHRVILSDELYKVLLTAGIVNEPLLEACSFTIYGRVGLPVIVEVCKWGDDRLLRAPDLWKTAVEATEHVRAEIREREAKANTKNEVDALERMEGILDKTYSVTGRYCGQNEPQPARR